MSKINQRHPYVAQLRKWYAPFFNIGMLCSLGVVILAFNWTASPRPAQPETMVEIEMEPVIEIERTVQHKKRTPPPPVLKPSTEIIAEEVPEFAPEPAPIPDEIATPVDEPIVAPAPPVVTPTKPPVVELPPEPEVQELPFIFVEEMPRFKGCEAMEGTKEEKKACAEKKLLTYIYDNIRYPAPARHNGVEGVVIVRFIIEKDGSISNIEIAKDIGAGCGKEAARVVKNMPTWIPGKQRGRAVRVKYNLPVRYRLR